MNKELTIPGPRGLPLLGVAPQLAVDPFGFCMRAAAQGDGLVRLKAGPATVYLVSHPDYVRHILITNAANYVKGSIMDGIRVALGNGLFTSDGDFWRRQRRLMQPAFHQRQIAAMGDIMSTAIHDAIHGWDARAANNQDIDLLDQATQLNIRIVIRSLFGTTADERELLELTDAVFAGMTKRVWSFFLPRWLPAPGGAAYAKAIKALDKHIYGIIAERRASAEQADLLGVLLGVTDEQSGERMSDQQIRDEIFTIFIAGYESTSTAVAWAWTLLADNPDVTERWVRELDEVLAGQVPTLADLPKLPYTQQLVNEVLRLYPAFPMYFRSSVEGDVVGPYRIPADAQLIVSPYATHHDPRFFENPERFDPERFAPENFSTQVRRAYYPFGMGQRRCIGEPMSLAIMQLLMARIGQRYTVALVNDGPVQGRYALTYQPKNGLPVRLSRRVPVAAS